ncbi:MAG: cytidine deaminase [Clostridia bacterium]|nr:cytidine deaminase [Clostridia bacterium]
MTKNELVQKATDAMKNAYAPYSKFTVGAALLSKNGKVYTGCNVENSSYGVTNCAERTALFSAIADGEREFCAIAIVGGKNGEIADFCLPCGVCRQALSEFCGEDFKIYLYNGKKIKEYKFSKILPLQFELR